MEKKDKPINKNAAFAGREGGVLLLHGSHEESQQFAVQRTCFGCKARLLHKVIKLSQFFFGQLMLAESCFSGQLNQVFRQLHFAESGKPLALAITLQRPGIGLALIPIPAVCAVAQERLRNQQQND